MDRFLVRFSVVLIAAAILVPISAYSQDSDAIIEQLSRSVKARKIDVQELREAVKNQIGSVKTPTGAGQVTTLPALSEELPSISFEVYFDYNSAALSPQSIPTLVQLGKALKDERLLSIDF